MVDYGKIGKFLQDVRKRKGISLYRLAKISGIPETTVRSYEQGRMPGIANTAIILNAMGIKLELVDVTDKGDAG